MHTYIVYISKGNFLLYYFMASSVTKSCTVIGYSSGQDGNIYLACYWTTPLCHVSRKPLDIIISSKNLFFIDQACSVKRARYWPYSFWCVFGPQFHDSQSVKNAKEQKNKKTLPIISSQLDQTSLVNNPYIWKVLKIKRRSTVQTMQVGVIGKCRLASVHLECKTSWTLVTYHEPV